jgi:hypothetical protein
MTNEELLAELDKLDIGVIKERIASGSIFATLEASCAGLRRPQGGGDK